MRMSSTGLIATAAQRLKEITAELPPVQGSVRMELFMIYSTLKHLSRELPLLARCNADKATAADGLRRELRQLLQSCRELAPARAIEAVLAAPSPPQGPDETSDYLVDVAAIADQLADSALPPEVADGIMRSLLAYLTACNQAELSLYRDSAPSDGG